MLFRGSRTHRAYLDANAPTKTYGFLTPRDRDIVSRIETLKTFSVVDHFLGTEKSKAVNDSIILLANLVYAIGW